MSDSVSVSFSDGKTQSVALHDQDGGLWRVEHARLYALMLQNELEDRRERGAIHWPLDRLEPDTVILDYLRFSFCEYSTIHRAGRIFGRLSLGQVRGTDRGHHVIDLSERIKTIKIGVAP